MKRSFTSSSKRRVWASLIVFFVTFAFILVAGQKVGRIMAKASFFNAGAIMDEGLTPARPLLDPQDWYVAYDDFHIDHYILYHGLDESINYVKQADVLLLGHSRVAYGFPKNGLERAERDTGLKFYNLGFGYVETSKFALALIDKQDLRPRVAIVNDKRFFMPNASEFGENVIKSSWWEAWKTVWEWKVTWRVRHFKLIEQLADWRVLRPTFGIFMPRLIVCRSISSGSWFALREHQKPVPVGTPPTDICRESGVVDEQTLSIARDFKRALAERGTDMVLTLVPYPGYWSDWGEIASLAAALEVPFILPVVEDLMTRDGGHLDDESAERFCSRFIEEFGEWLKESGTMNKQ